MSYLNRGTFFYFILSLYLLPSRLDACHMSHRNRKDVYHICVIYILSVRHDVFTRDMTHENMWRDSFICVTWLIHMRNTCRFPRPALLRAQVTDRKKLHHLTPNYTTLHHTAPHGTTWHCTATRCNIPQHAVTHWTTPHHTAPHCITPANRHANRTRRFWAALYSWEIELRDSSVHSWKDVTLMNESWHTCNEGSNMHVTLVSESSHT